MNRYHALFPSIITESKCDSFKDICHAVELNNSDEDRISIAFNLG